MFTRYELGTDFTEGFTLPAVREAKPAKPWEDNKSNGSTTGLTITQVDEVQPDTHTSKEVLLLNYNLVS